MQKPTTKWLEQTRYWRYSYILSLWKFNNKNKARLCVRALYCKCCSPQLGDWSNPRELIQSSSQRGANSQQITLWWLREILRQRLGLQLSILKCAVWVLPRWKESYESFRSSYTQKCFTEVGAWSLLKYSDASSPRILHEMWLCLRDR